MVDTGVVWLFDFSKNRHPGPFKKTTTEPIKEPAVFDRLFDFSSIFRSIVVIHVWKLGLGFCLRFAIMKLTGLYELGEVKGISEYKDLPIISFNDSRIL